MLRDVRANVHSMSRRYLEISESNDGGVIHIAAAPTHRHALEVSRMEWLSKLPWQSLIDGQGSIIAWRPPGSALGAL